jgi:hypothetical protein
MKIRIFSPSLLLVVIFLSGQFFAQGLGDLPAVTKPPEKTAPKPPKPKPTPQTKSLPKPKNARGISGTPIIAASYLRNPAKFETITFNQQVSDKLDFQTSGRITATSFYNEYKLSGSPADLFTVQLETTDPNLAVQIYDSNQVGQPILKDPLTKEFKLATPGGALPAEGEYKVRVLGTLGNGQSLPYSLQIKRTGLTEEGYLAKLDTIIKGFNQSGAKNIDGTINQLQELIDLAPARTPAYETLGVAYLYFRKDLVKAVEIMEKTIRMGGSAKFKVTHDLLWRKARRSKTGDGLEWEDRKESWLYIRQGQVALTDAANTNQTYFSLGSQQIREISRVSSSPGIAIKSQTSRAPTYLFVPITLDQAESDIIVNLVKNYVQVKR